MSKYKTRKEALKAVRSNGRNLYNVDERLKDDEEIVEMALKHGGILAHASVRLQNDASFILREARRKDAWEFDFDKALFCAKRDWALCQKYKKLYEKSDEFQIIMRLHYGERYLSTIRRYNFMSDNELQSALYVYRKKQVAAARNIYVKGYDSDYILEHEELYNVAGHSSLQWAAVSLRKEGQPFSDILDYYPKQIENERRMIDEYCCQSPGGSYPERLMNSLLTLLDVDFAREQTFPWSTGVTSENGETSSKRYDFYVPSLSTIIEVHGAQHYDGGFERLGGRSLEEEQANDKQKEQLARDNGIKHYLVINALSSTLAFIKESILSNNEFCALFDLANVNWDEVEAGTVEKVKTDIAFPLYEEKVQRYKEWADAIKSSLVASDYIALCSTSKSEGVSDSKELLENIKNSFPSSRGLYPHELLILQEAHYYRYPLDEQHIPGKWYYDFGIGNPSKYIDKLIHDGFLTTGDVRSAVESSTLPVIKRVLVDHNLPTKGRKAELVELLLDNISIDELNQFFPNRCLKLTELGEKELKDNSYLLAKNWYGLSVWTLNRIAHAFPNDSIDDILEEYGDDPQKFLAYLSEEEIDAFGLSCTDAMPTHSQSLDINPPTESLPCPQKLSDNSTDNKDGSQMEKAASDSNLSDRSITKPKNWLQATQTARLILILLFAAILILLCLKVIAC